VKFSLDRTFQIESQREKIKSVESFILGTYKIKYLHNRYSILYQLNGNGVIYDLLEEPTLFTV